jgi:hypothetical protein
MSGIAADDLSLSPEDELVPLPIQLRTVCFITACIYKSVVALARGRVLTE